MRLPSSVTFSISRRAGELVQLFAPKKSGRGASRLVPISDEGMVGIDIPEDVAYMYYEDKGMDPYAMTGLAGKVIPIRNKDGSIAFRRASASTIGQKKVITRTNQGQLISSKVQWVHPGEAPMGFIEKAVNMAVSEWKNGLTYSSTIRMLRDSDAKDAVNDLLGPQ